jgi:carbon-monoxide dehydrogenase medium subunit
VITQEFDFHAPTGVEEVLGLLAEHGDEAKLLAGGMSLMPTMNLGLARPGRVISLNHVRGLDGVRVDGPDLRIGAMTRHAQVARDPLIARHAPALQEAAALVGDPQVRNRGTIGGSLSHADPAADYLPVMAVLGGALVIRSARGERTLPADEFFVDVLQTALEPDELLVEVVVPGLGDGDGSAYRRLARVEGSFAIVSAAGVVRAGRAGARVAIGGVAGQPVVVDVGSQVAGGVTREALALVARAVEAACVGAFADLSGDSDYRQAMAGVYARRVIEAAAANSR